VKAGALSLLAAGGIAGGAVPAWVTPRAAGPLCPDRSMVLQHWVPLYAHVLRRQGRHAAARRCTGREFAASLIGSLAAPCWSCSGCRSWSVPASR
jgi:hypothetical protein